MPSREEQYPLGDDGLVVEKVGAWAKTKHKLLTDYVQASGGARSHYNMRSGAAYIDVFCGPGRLLVRDTGEYIDGSPVAAYKQGLASPAPFASIEISDWDKELLGAADLRLRAQSACRGDTRTRSRGHGADRPKPSPWGPAFCVPGPS